MPAKRAGSFGICGAVEQKALQISPCAQTNSPSATHWFCLRLSALAALHPDPDARSLRRADPERPRARRQRQPVAGGGHRHPRRADRGHGPPRQRRRGTGDRRRGLTVSPGFIDVHSHATQGLEGALKEARQLIAQGITTVALNPDGGGTTDLRAQRAGFEQRGVGVNVALYVPHGSIRRDVIGMADRAPTPAELDRMIALARNGMEAGGIGLSSGLYYAPGSYAKTEEVIALAKVVGEMGGVYESHIRDEADYNIGVVGAVQEVIRIAEEGRLPGIVAHMKALGPASWGLSMALVERIRQARDRGVEVYADQYPYEASGTGIVGALIPRWAEVGGRAELLEADRGRGARSTRGRHPPELRTARRAGQARDLAIRAESGVRGSVARAGGEDAGQAG